MEKVIRRPKRLTLEEYNKIHRLVKEGISQKEVAIMTRRSPSSVWHVLNTVNIKSLIKQESKKGEVNQAGNDLMPFEEEDFSCKPDDVLFKHTREYIF